jgi:hypothetical protein
MPGAAVPSPRSPVERDWATEGPIAIASRIDTPAPGASGVLPYDFAPGRHSITPCAPRAWTGEVQTETRTTPFPADSSDRHSVQVVAA